MADLKGFGHVYECVPPLPFNKDGSIKVKLKCVPRPDFEKYTDMEQAYGLEEKRRKGHEFIGKYFAGIEGLTVDGKEISTWDEVYNLAPMELYSWIYGAVLSHEVLSKAEVKN